MGREGKGMVNGPGGEGKRVKEEGKLREKEKRVARVREERKGKGRTGRKGKRGVGRGRKEREGKGSRYIPNRWIDGPVCYTDLERRRK